MILDDILSEIMIKENKKEVEFYRLFAKNKEFKAALVNNFERALSLGD